MPEHLDRVRTPLLTLITLQSLDEDYEVVSRRREATNAASPARGRRLAWVMVVLVLFGLLVSVAAVQKSRDEGTEDASRESLIAQINEQRTSVGKTEQRLSDLRADNSKADAALTGLGSRLTAAQSRTAELGALTGFGAVSGPALRVTLDSSPYADANSRVRDSDIALLVDALWGAGAEAITVNGQRVTGRTGIRTSGDAVEVNGVGVAPPYTILAIGDTNQLSADFLNSTGGQAFVTLADQYDFRYDLHDVGQVRMGAAPPATGRLRSAQRMSTDHPESQRTKKSKRGRTP